MRADSERAPTPAASCRADEQGASAATAQRSATMTVSTNLSLEISAFKSLNPTDSQ
jgi:hypothetical protein